MFLWNVYYNDFIANTIDLKAMKIYGTMSYSWSLPCFLLLSFFTLNNPWKPPESKNPHGPWKSEVHEKAMTSIQFNIILNQLQGLFRYNLRYVIKESKYNRLSDWLCSVILFLNKATLWFYCFFKTSCLCCQKGNSDLLWATLMQFDWQIYQNF